VPKHTQNTRKIIIGTLFAPMEGMGLVNHLLSYSGVLFGVTENFLSEKSSTKPKNSRSTRETIMGYIYLRQRARSQEISCILMPNLRRNIRNMYAEKTQQGGSTIQNSIHSPKKFIAPNCHHFGG